MTQSVNDQLRAARAETTEDISQTIDNLNIFMSRFRRNPALMDAPLAEAVAERALRSPNDVLRRLAQRSLREIVVFRPDLISAPLLKDLLTASLSCKDYGTGHELRTLFLVALRQHDRMPDKTLVPNVMNHLAGELRAPHELAVRRKLQSLTKPLTEDGFPLIDAYFVDGLFHVAKRDENEENILRTLKNLETLFWNKNELFDKNGLDTLWALAAAPPTPAVCHAALRTIQNGMHQSLVQKKNLDFLDDVFFMNALSRATHNGGPEGRAQGLRLVETVFAALPEEQVARVITPQRLRILAAKTMDPAQPVRIAARAALVCAAERAPHLLTDAFYAETFEENAQHENAFRRAQTMRALTALTDATGLWADKTAATAKEGLQDYHCQVRTAALRSFAPLLDWAPTLVDDATVAQIRRAAFADKNGEAREAAQIFLRAGIERNLPILWRDASLLKEVALTALTDPFEKVRASAVETIHAILERKPPRGPYQDLLETLLRMKRDECDEVSWKAGTVFNAAAKENPEAATAATRTIAATRGMSSQGPAF